MPAMFKVTIAAFLVFFSQVALAAPQTQPRLQTYDELLGAIRQTRAASAQRIEALVEQEKVREAWETGKLIDVHVLQHQERAAYGEQVIIRLAKDLGSSETELKYMLQFARTYPIRRPADELSWSHYQTLLSLNDPKEREEVAKEALRKGWNRDQLREEVRRRLARDLPQSKLPEAKPGKTYTYRVVKAAVGPYKDQLALDLGFSTYFQPKEIKKFKKGDIVKWNVRARSPRPGEETSPLQKIPNAADADLFTYHVYVTQVIDGDTFHALIDLGFNIVMMQTLRLRGLDAPEIYTSEGSPGRDIKISPGSPRATGLEGKEAKAFVEAEFSKAGGKILIKTVKSDKYDRYLADVFVDGKYLNEELLEKDLAVAVN